MKTVSPESVNVGKMHARSKNQQAGEVAAVNLDKMGR